MRAGGIALSLVKDQRGGTLVGVREPVHAVVVSARKFREKHFNTLLKISADFIGLCANLHLCLLLFQSMI